MQDNYKTHCEVILENIGYDKWISRDLLQTATQSKNLSARLSNCRAFIPSTSKLICYKRYNKLRYVIATYYAIVAKDLLDNSKQTTYSEKTLPKAVKDLIWLPKEDKTKWVFKLLFNNN